MNLRNLTPEDIDNLPSAIRRLMDAERQAVRLNRSIFGWFRWRYYWFIATDTACDRFLRWTGRDTPEQRREKTASKLDELYGKNR